MLTAATPLPESPRDGLSPVEFAVRKEMARRLADYLLISTRLGYEQRWTRETLLPFAEEMGALLGWSAETQSNEIEHVLNLTALPQ